uniref:Putative secreted protein n=1 Tax=Ixodes ricinus TaxID=34613 RepID=A0A6B0TQY4_IXORI
MSRISFFILSKTSSLTGLALSQWDCHRVLVWATQSQHMMYSELCPGQKMSSPDTHLRPETHIRTEHV